MQPPFVEVEEERGAAREGQDAQRARQPPPRQHRGAAQRRDDPDRDRQQREQLVLEHERIDEDLGEALRPVGPRLGIAAGDQVDAERHPERRRHRVPREGPRPPRLPDRERGQRQQDRPGHAVRELRVERLGRVPRVVRGRRDTAVGPEPRVALREHAVGIRVPRPDVGDRERRVPADEWLAAGRMSRRARARARRRQLAEVAVVARRLVSVPHGAGQRVVGRHGRQRVLHADELPGAVTLDVEQHRRRREIERTRREGTRLRRRLHEMIAVPCLHPARLEVAVGARVRDVRVARGRAAHLGHDLLRSATCRRPRGRDEEQGQNERDGAHGFPVYGRTLR